MRIVRTSKVYLLAGLTVGGMACTGYAQTIAHWNFDQGTPETAFAPEGGGAAAVPDQSGNGYWMHGWDAQYGPSFSALGVTPSGSGLSMRLNGGQDGYTTDATINGWSPLAWTIETSVKLDSVSGFLTIIGRDGSSHEVAESDFYLQRHDGEDSFRLNFATVGGERVIIDTEFSPQANVWYGLAAVSNGTEVFLYADQSDGNGYQLAGSATFTGEGAANSLASPNANWTFGRGWYNGGHVDRITGNMDNIRFTEGALEVGELMVIPEPSTYALLAGFGALGLSLLRRRLGQYD